MWITGEKGLVKGRLRCDTYDSNIKMQLLLNVIEIKPSTLHLSAVKSHHLDAMDFILAQYFWPEVLILLLMSVGKKKGGTTGMWTIVNTYI